MHAEQNLRQARLGLDADSREHVSYLQYWIFQCNLHRPSTAPDELGPHTLVQRTRYESSQREGRVPRSPCAQARSCSPSMCLGLQGIGIDLLPRPGWCPQGCAHSYWTSARRCCRFCCRLPYVQCRYPGLRPAPRPALREHAALLLKDENSQFQAEEYSLREKPILPSKDAVKEQKRRVHSSHGPCPGTSPLRSQAPLSSAKNRCCAHLRSHYSSRLHRRRAPCQKASSIRSRRQRRTDVSPAIVASQKDSQSPKHCSTLPMC